MDTKPMGRNGALAVIALGLVFVGSLLADLPDWSKNTVLTGGVLLTTLGTVELVRGRKKRDDGEVKREGPGVVAVQGLTHVALAGWDRALAQTEKTGQAEQEKARLATDLATEKATNAGLSASVTELVASNRELAKLARSNLFLAQRVEEMRLQGEQRFDAAMTTLQNITRALAEPNTGKAVSFARQFWEAVEFYIKTPPSPPGPDGFPPGYPTEAMRLFRAIGIAKETNTALPVTPKLSSADSETPPSTEGGNAR